MVNIRTDRGAALDVANLEQGLEQLIQQGSVLPIISSEALEDLVLDGHDRLVAAYADHTGYPLNDRTDLHKMAKYQSLTKGWKDRQLKQDYLDAVGTHLFRLAGQHGVEDDSLAEAAEQAERFTLSQFANNLGYPRLHQGREDPLLILANLGLPLYITTSAYTFLEDALQRAGTDPQTEFCRWHPGLGNLPALDQDYHPSRQKPLVYHLYGLDAYPESLLLTEDDYLDFLMAVSQGRGKGRGVDPVHDEVKGALQSSAVLLLGFGLASWAFRVLYRGLIKPMPDAKLYERYCCLQVVPSAQEKQYLEDYLRKEARFDEVYWQEIGPFCRSRLRVNL